MGACWRKCGVAMFAIGFGVALTGNNGCWLQSAEIVPGVFVGMFHVASVDDATNLTILRSGTFTWEIDSCDSRGGGAGTVFINEDESISLIPGGAGGFPTTLVPGFSSPTLGRPREVTVTQGQDDAIITTSEEGTLTWSPGHVCSICEGFGAQFSSGIEPCE